MSAGAKMSVLCSIPDNRIQVQNSIVRHVAVNGEAVNSNMTAEDTVWHEWNGLTIKAICGKLYLSRYGG